DARPERQDETGGPADDPAAESCVPAEPSTLPLYNPRRMRNHLELTVASGCHNPGREWLVPSAAASWPDSRPATRRARASAGCLRDRRSTRARTDSPPGWYRHAW